MSKYFIKRQLKNFTNQILRISYHELSKYFKGQLIYARYQDTINCIFF